MALLLFRNFIPKNLWNSTSFLIFAYMIDDEKLIKYILL